MTKRTSKSVSETQTTSAPSGASAPAGDGAKKARRAGKFARAAVRINGMDLDQFRQSLVSAGIATKAGTLNEKYKGHRKTKRA